MDAELARVQSELAKAQGDFAESGRLGRTTEEARVLKGEILERQKEDALTQAQRARRADRGRGEGQERRGGGRPSSPSATPETRPRRPRPTSFGSCSRRSGSEMPPRWPRGRPSRPRAEARRRGEEEGRRRQRRSRRPPTRQRTRAGAARIGDRREREKREGSACSGVVAAESIV